MDRNIIILIIFLLLLLFYDTFCNSKILEASDTEYHQEHHQEHHQNTIRNTIRNTNRKNEGITTNPDLMNGSRNSFKYENTNPPNSGFLGNIRRIFSTRFRFRFY